jgi:hypothetical protein
MTAPAPPLKSQSAGVTSYSSKFISIYMVRSRFISIQRERESERETNAHVKNTHFVALSENLVSVLEDFLLFFQPTRLEKIQSAKSRMSE